MTSGKRTHAMVVVLCVIAGCSDATQVPDRSEDQISSLDIGREHFGELTYWERDGDGPWSVATAVLKPVKSLKLPGQAMSVAFSQNSQWLACGSPGRVTVWDPTRDTVFAKLEAQGAPRRLQFQSSRLFVQYRRSKFDGIVEMWDLETGERRDVTPGLSFAFSPSGQLLVLKFSSQGDNEVPHARQGQDEKARLNVASSQSGSARRAEQASDRFSVTPGELYVEVFSEKDFRLLKRLPRLQLVSPDLYDCGIRVTPNGRFAIVSDARRLFVLDLHSSELIASHDLKVFVCNACVIGNDSAVLGISRSISRETLLRYSVVDRSFTDLPCDVSAFTDALTFSMKRQLLAVGSAGYPSDLWVLNTLGTRVAWLKCQEEKIHDITFSSAGHQVATCGADRWVHVWDVEEIVQERARPM